jgi:hypothetical protein
VNIPSPNFQTATLANLAATGNAAEVPFYNQIFSIYNNAPGASRAADVLPNGGCSTGFTLPSGGPCALKFQSNINNLTTEWLMTARVDQNIGDHDRVFVHFRTDHGLQATITDPLSPVLNAQSVQPQYEGQLQWSHQAGANGMNQLILAGSWYSAIFQPPNLAKAVQLMPFQLTFGSGEFATPGSAFYNTWPQGRNVTQYQISDDFSWLKGSHNLKFGVNFRRNDITDYTPGGFLNTIPIADFNDLTSFFNGTADVFQQAFASRPTQPLALYSLGFYGQDEWSVRKNLKVTLSLRAEHNSNPVCQTNCFARLASSFLDISHDVTQPYNQAISSGLHQALPNYQSISWQPRFGFAWQPFGEGKTVVRGGVGIFSDIFPGTIATLYDTNSPLKNTFVISGLPFAPGVPGNAASAAAASNAAFITGFAAGQTFTDISNAVTAAGATFSPPAFTSAARRIQYPSYQKWNLEVQQALGQRNSFSLNYVGNHGSDLAASNAGLNAFCDPVVCAPSLGISSFIGLPAAVPDQRFGTITEIGNYGVSNYNGLTASFTRRMSSTFQVQASFTWSHALDSISNGGFLPFNFNTNASILTPQNPYNFKQYNYGNADYDVRKQANISYMYHTPKLKNRLWDALSDWTISGVLFVRSGLPFTAIDGANTFGLSSFNYGPGSVFTQTLFANSFVGPISCSSDNKFNNFVVTPACMTSAEFASAVGPNGVGTFGNQRRNQIYGPNYFDTDLTLMKNFRIPKWEGAELQIGAQAFNILNHPNFDQPINDIGNSEFGYSVTTVATPTSIFGAFLGASASPRQLQIRAQLRF